MHARSLQRSGDRRPVHAESRGQVVTRMAEAIERDRFGDLRRHQRGVIASDVDPLPTQVRPNSLEVHPERLCQLAHAGACFVALHEVGDLVELQLPVRTPQMGTDAALALTLTCSILYDFARIDWSGTCERQGKA